MSNGFSTAGQTVSSISPMLSAIPYVGTFLSAAGTIAGGIMQKKEAEKQAEEAARIRKDAMNTQKQALRPEFIKKRRMDEMAFLSGLPGYDLAKENIGEEGAVNLRAIRDYSPNGASAVSAISSALALSNKAQRDLDIKNATYKAGKLEDIGTTEWNIGEKERQLEDIRDKEKREGLIAANAYENAATANRMNAINTITGAVGSTATGISNISKNQQYMKMLADIYGSDSTAMKTNPIVPATSLTDTTSPSTLNLPQGNTIQNVSLSQKEQFDLINQLIQQGKAKDQSEGILLLRQMGYNV